MPFLPESLKKTWWRARLATVLLAVCAWLPLTGGAAERVTVVVLATTDLHGNIYPLDPYRNQPAARGLAKIASLVAEARRAHPGAILIDCGDTIEGSPVEYVHQRDVRKRGKAAPPDPMMLVMNYLRYDAMVVGNHEFNFGQTVLQKARGEADFPWISANVAPAATAEEALAVKKRQYSSAAEHMAARTFEPMLFVEVQGVKVAIIGLTTSAVPEWEAAEHIAGYRFEPPPLSARFWVHHARQVREADVVVLAAHTGLERDPVTGEAAPGQAPGENTVYQLAAGTPGVDAIVFGHTHREVPQQELNGVLLVQPKNWGQSLAELTFVLEREQPSDKWKVVSKSARAIPVTAETAADAKVLELAKSYQDAAETYLSTPVAEAAGALEGLLGRVTDTALLDRIHDVQLAAAQAQISFAALFDPSLTIPRGPVTVRQLAALYLYDNTLVAVEMTGRAVKEALEHSALFYNQYQPGRPAPLINPQVFGFNYDTAAGVTYQVDISQPPGSRIVDLRFAGKPIELDGRYRVAINSYRKSGGGGFAMFRDARELWRSAVDVRQLMIDYYAAKKSIPAGADGNWQIVPAAAREALIREVTSPTK